LFLYFKLTVYSSFFIQGAALVLILLGWLKITPQKNYRIWVEICSQVLNGLFTIPVSIVLYSIYFIGLTTSLFFF
jgi:hypothetical protein